MCQITIISPKVVVDRVGRKINQQMQGWRVAVVLERAPIELQESSSRQPGVVVNGEVSSRRREKGVRPHRATIGV